MTIVIATGNVNKKTEITAIMDTLDLPITVLTLTDLGVTAQVEESGTTFAANAAIKAIFYSKLTEKYTVAEDSGLEVHALHGAPGVFSARFAGEGATDNERMDKLLHAMTGVIDRQARFVCALAVARHGQVVFQCEGAVAGEISKQKSGAAGFGYDPVFYLPERQKTFAELSVQEKNVFSHRAAACRELSHFLRALQKSQ